MKEPEIVVCGIPFGTPQEAEALKYVKDHGFTSVQIYTHWNMFEPNARGEFDWSVYDPQVRALQAAGLKFVPFFLMGPQYAAPQWWLDDPRHTDLVCLEHGKNNPIESIWNPEFRVEVDRVMAAFAEHYRSWNVLESFQPGICGDYGEAIYPVHGNWPEAYHTHRGYWCGGEDAVASFRAAMTEKYGTVDALNTAWRSHYADFSELRPFLRHRASSRTAWLDQIDWYNASMDEYTDFWLGCSRKHFPELPIYLCTGGSEEPEHGSVFPTQAQLAAKYNAGIRLTNEGNNFFTNLHDTIHMYSACELYGAYLGLEPVGPMLKQGVAVRTFGSALYGNRQIFHYYGNLLDKDGYTGAGDVILQYRDMIREHPSEGRITMFWPLTQAHIDGEKISKNVLLALSELRKLYEVRVADEKMIMDGALEQTEILIMLDAKCSRTEVLERIADWVSRGGKVLCNHRTLSVELEPVPAFDEIFGITAESEEASGHTDFISAPEDWMIRSGNDTVAHAEKSWLRLTPDTALLAKHVMQKNINGVTEQITGCVSTFSRNFGKGKTVFYSGMLDLDTPADAIFTPSPFFRDLLIDFCRAFCGIEAMEVQPDEVIRGHIDGKTWALTKDARIIQVD